MTERVLGVVCADRCGTLQPRMFADQIAEWADDPERDVELIDVVVVESEAEFPRLFASLAPAGVSVVVVPALWHVYGWMGTIRVDADLWTLQPQECCWPRKPLPPPTPPARNWDLSSGRRWPR